MSAVLVVGIGLGSAAFHATLQYEAQLLDELPMIMYIVHTVAVLSNYAGHRRAVGRFKKKRK